MIKIIPSTNKSKITGASGANIAEVNDDGQLHVVLRGAVDPCNSTSTPLAADATFTGDWCDVLDYGIVFITMISDVASAVDGVIFELSSDGVNVDNEDPFTFFGADSGKTFSYQPATNYMRVKYTNGSVDQTYFRMQIVLKKTNAKPSSHNIGKAIADDDDAELVKAVLTARKDDGVFVNITATNSGNLKVASVENGLTIAKGEVVGTSFIHKFGQAPDFDIADGFVTVWDGANDAGINVMNYVYSTTAAIDSLSSSSASDTVPIEVRGLDANYEEVTQTITLTGQTRAPLTTNLIRVFRMTNKGSVDIVGNVFCYEDTPLSGGAPIITTKIRAVISDGSNQTLMAIYTVPAGKKGYMRNWYAATTGAKKDSAHVVRLVARPFGGVFQLKHVASIVTAGSSNVQHVYEEPEVFAAKTDIAMRVNTDSDAAAVGAGFDIVLIDE